IELPHQRVRPSEQTYHGSACPVVLDDETVAQLRHLNRSEGATLFMTVLAALTAFLSRYTGQDDIVVGTPVAGRYQPEFEGMLGLFANTLVMRNSVPETTTLRQLIRQVRDHAFEAYDHQDVPFELLVDELQPDRDLAQSPLFQVLLALQNTPPSSWSFSGLDVEPIHIKTDSAKFDLTFAFTERGSSLHGGLTYSTDLFDKAFITGLITHFQTFVQNAVENPDAPVATLEMLSDEERRTLLKVFNDTSRDYSALSADKNGIHQFFEHQAEVEPNRIAILHNGVAVTYEELNARANSVAARVLEVLPGLGESFVAVCLPRTPDLIAALLGVLKAGCAFLALDANYPPARLAGMMEDASPICLITLPELSMHLPASTPRIYVEEIMLADAATPSDSSPKPKQDGASAAYVIYTSGSTGRPKGAVIEHRSAVTLLHWARGVFRTDSLSGVLASTSICFDLSIFEIFVPLSWGGTIILAENALELPTLPDRDRVRLINTVPSALTELIRINGLPESIKIVNLAGEALSRKLVDQIYERDHVQGLFNLYGPTEDTTYSTCTLLPRAETGPVSIGKPIANTETFVLSPAMLPVPIGVAGELYIAGAGLARCYLNRPDMTAERFVPNPFGPPGSRMYRTGDLARWRHDGNLDYLGRIDHQVKIRGFRMELGEIESALLKHPGVAQAAVLVREDRPGDKRLVAYYVPVDASLVQDRDLRSGLAQTLPAFMIPSSFVSMPAFPVTSNGKIDRKGFRPPSVRPDLQQRYLPANDPLRSQLVTIWESLLGIMPVGIRDDFFRIGGDSLLAVQLVHRIQRVCGVKLPLGILFRHPTIESLSKELVQRESETWSTPLLEIQAGNPAIKAPFFYLHADFVSGGFYSVDLARRLGQDQPFFVLQPHGLDGGDVPATIEEMAAQHLEVLRRVQPNGPYYLGGKCNGALISFEMARRLREENEEVRLLAIVHGWAGALYNRVEQALKPANRPPKAELMNSSNYQTRKMWAFYRYMWAIKTYMPRRYPGKITLLWPEGIPIKGSDPTLGWSQVADQVDSYPIPGDAYTCITRHMDQLGSQLKSLLESAQACAMPGV
ncbi:MAG: amino acid adenylation domain-containing protein, partial [Bryobacteraceae bacterium]|nr:amino acid adenylation domain-containing protein [Bryobacteraceae bacterium]